jgi:hypothetical protein
LIRVVVTVKNGERVGNSVWPGERGKAMSHTRGEVESEELMHYMGCDVWCDV